MASIGKSLTSKSSSTPARGSTSTSTPTVRTETSESSFTVTSDFQSSETRTLEIRLSIRMPSLTLPKDTQTLFYVASWLFAKGERLLKRISARSWGLTGDSDVSLIRQVRAPDGSPVEPHSTTLGRTYRISR